MERVCTPINDWMFYHCDLFAWDDDGMRACSGKHWVIFLGGGKEGGVSLVVMES